MRATTEEDLFISTSLHDLKDWINNRKKEENFKISKSNGLLQLLNPYRKKSFIAIIATISPGISTKDITRTKQTLKFLIGLKGYKIQQEK